MKEITTSQEFANLLKKMFKKEHWFYDCYVAEIQILEKPSRSYTKRWNKIYHCKLWRGAFNEHPIIFEKRYFRYLNREELTMLLLSKLHNGSYFIDWKNKNINKHSEVLG